MMPSIKIFKLFLFITIAAMGQGCYMPEEAVSNLTTAPFSLASYYTSHMVLQKAPQAAKIWGYAAISDIGQQVTVTLTGEDLNNEYKVTVMKGPSTLNAIWSVILDPIEKGGPYMISAELEGYESIVIKDIMFGDVWLCSGQSNMEFQMFKMFGGSFELWSDDVFQDIRMLTTPCTQSPTPLYDFSDSRIMWKRPMKGDPSWSSFSAVCFMFGKYLYEQLTYPIGLIDDTWGGTPLEAWSSRDALRECGLEADELSEDEDEDPYFTVDKRPHPHRNSLLWNGMIHPLINLSIKGAIWYQGEANTAYHTDQYSCSFPAMITDWRMKFHKSTEGQVPIDMPFGFVQIGPNSNPKQVFGYPMIRWHQMGDEVTKLPLPNMFMAVAMDLTDPMSPFANVHFRDKNTVAKRLSHAALCTIYGLGSQLLTFPYPTYEKILRIPQQVLIQFGNDKVQINVRKEDGFEVCCAESYANCPMNSLENWVPAPIMKFNTTTVRISFSQCATRTVVAYRYAWRDVPCNYQQCAVYSDYSGDPLPTYTRQLPKILEVEDMFSYTEAETQQNELKYVHL